jgi:energy-coupling factor transport system permease protein
MVLFKDIVLGQYLPVNSAIHRLDPRTKFIAVVAIMVLTLVVSNIWTYVLLLASLMGVIFLAKLPIGFILRNLRSFMWLFVLTFGIHLLFTAGRALPYLGVGTVEGFWRGLFFCLRVAILIISAALLTLTTSPLELTDGLEKILSPLGLFGLSSHALALMLVIALRFIPTFIEEANNIQKAQLARGASFNGNLVQRARSLVPLLVPLFLSAFRRADELAVAMEARNYRTDGPRTHFRELKFSAGDYRSLVLLVIFTCGCLLVSMWLSSPIGS